jgi:hypothetical protein
MTFSSTLPTRRSEILYKARKTLEDKFELDDENTLAVRKIVHEIVSELSMIGGFCDKWSKQYIERINDTVATMTSVKIYYPFALMLEILGCNGEQHNRRLYKDTT